MEDFTARVLDYLKRAFYPVQRSRHKKLKLSLPVFRDLFLDGADTSGLDFGLSEDGVTERIDNAVALCERSIWFVSRSNAS
jgi:hypothetical protein